jgi:hypothetical protein
MLAVNPRKPPKACLLRGKKGLLMGAACHGMQYATLDESINHQAAFIIPA